jgi:hypothetical protein
MFYNIKQHNHIYTESLVVEHSCLLCPDLQEQLRDVSDGRLFAVANYLRLPPLFFATEWSFIGSKSTII